MSKGYQNWASEVAYFIDFDFAIFAEMDVGHLFLTTLFVIFLITHKKHEKGKN